jgi:hypothetical protein
MGRVLTALALAMAATAPLVAIDLDVTPGDVERALSIARSREPERAQFHAPYIQSVNHPIVQSAEIVSEYRRAVLIVEERERKGDRMFGYSVTHAQKALGPWKQRLAIKVRLRFHPQNNYVEVPDVEIRLVDNERALIGVLKEPVLSLPSPVAGDRLPILGAIVEGVFDAVTVGQGVREFVIRLDGKELTRVKFDLSSLD